MGKANWKWFGMPAHFIGGNDCIFHMATQVGRYLVSSVGMYIPKSSMNLSESVEIGHKRKYETYVFETISGNCACGCGLPKINLSEIDSLPANTVAEAQANHMKLCAKWNRRTGGRKDGKAKK